MVFPSEGFDPDSCLKAISDEKCTPVYGVPTMFVGMLQYPEFESFDFSQFAPASWRVLPARSRS